jgi:hypothetical protein
MRISVLLLAVVLVGCNGGGEEPEVVVEPDERPILTLTEPLDDTVATPEVAVTASCSDDRGDCRILLAVLTPDPNVLSLGAATNELSRVLDLSEFDGQTIVIRADAVDSAGQERGVGRDVHVESSPRLANERAFPDLVVDFDGQRALLQREVDPIGSELTIVEAASGIEENVEVPGQFVIHEAYLTPTGAAYAGLLEDALPEAYDWNHSLLVELGTGGQSLQVAGDYAAWVDENDIDLLRRRFSTMTDLVVHRLATVGHSVASNGVVAFSGRTSVDAHDQITMFDAGVATALTADVDRDNGQPRTDGQGVVYFKTDGDVYEIAFHDGTGEIILSGPRTKFPQAGSDYAIAGGWVAFTELVDVGHAHVWTRDPSGALLQRTAFDVDSRIETLAPDGEVMVVTPEARYLSRPTGELSQVSSELGRSTKIGDTWYVIIGRSVFEVR